MDLKNLSKDAAFTVNGGYAPLVVEASLADVLTYEASIKPDEVMADQLKELRKRFNSFVGNELKAWFDKKAESGYITSKQPNLKEHEKAYLLDNLVEDTGVCQTLYSHGVIQVRIGLPMAIILTSGTPDTALSEAFLNLRKKIAQVFKEATEEYGIGSATREKWVTLQCIAGTAAELGFDVELEV